MDDWKTLVLAEPVVSRAPTRFSVIEPKPHEPLKDLITGQPLERLTRLVGAFARAGLSGSVDPRDAMWLGSELGGLREFFVLKSDHRWVNQIIEALSQVLGPHRHTWDPEALTLVVRLRRMQGENWPPSASTWNELLSLIEDIRNPGIGSKVDEVKSKGGRPRKGPTLSDLARLVEAHGDTIYNQPIRWFGEQLGVPKSTIGGSELWEKVRQMRESVARRMEEQDAVRGRK